MSQSIFKDFFELEKFSHKRIFNNIENMWDVFRNLEKYLQEAKLNKIECNIPKNCYLENLENISIGKNTIIEPFTYIKGPCIIGENCQIRHGAYIRGSVITGNNCIIGHCSEVKNSIFLDNVHAAHFAYIGDSILGNNVNLGAGVKLANFRLDKNLISFYKNAQKIYTNLQKLGSFIGDDSQIGCNCVLNPATFLEKEVFCHANLNICGWIFQKSIIKYSKKL